MGKDKERRYDVVWRLLRRNIAPGQLIGYALAGLTGLLVIITAVQLYADMRSSADGADPMVSSDYLILSRRVDGLGVLSGAASGFSQDDLADISSQPWVRKVGKFTASDFSVTAAVDFGGGSMSTYLFFESIPDEFLDRVPQTWSFDPEQPFVPIVLSKDYLALYNFGFAASRGMPRVSESMIGLIPLRVSISGNGRQMWLPARVVGFSSRLNTIAVPQQFMDWANAMFAEPSRSGAVASRIIVEVDNPGNPAISDYLDAHGLESAGDKVTGGRVAYLLSMFTVIVISIGVVITVLAVFILLLSLYLLLNKSEDKLRSLMLLGYTPMQLARYYVLLVSGINLCVLVVGIVLLLVARQWWTGLLEQAGMSGASPVVAVAVAVGIMSLVSAIDVLAIRRHIRFN